MCKDLPSLRKDTIQATFHFSGMSSGSHHDLKNSKILRRLLLPWLGRIAYRTPWGPGDEEVLQGTSAIILSPRTLNTMSIRSNGATATEWERTDGGCYADTLL